MCFSAEADLAAGLVVGAIGVDALRHVRRSIDRPLAALPVVLAVHLLIEVFVWLGLEERLPYDQWRPALWLYLAIAFGVLPVLVPLAVEAASEPAPGRRRLRLFVAAGIAVAVMLLHAMVRGPVEASIEGRHIAYDIDLWHPGLVLFLYVVAICGSMLLSEHAHVRWFGGANLVAVAVLGWLDKSGFISLWCFWAAIGSVAIAVHLRYADLGVTDARRSPRKLLGGAG